jgi:hypothetical protein
MSNISKVPITSNKKDKSRDVQNEKVAHLTMSNFYFKEKIENYK